MSYPTKYDGAMMKPIHGERRQWEQQLELSFDGAARPGACSPARHRLARAAWWFEKMHQTVEQALEWRSHRPACPQQSELLWVSE